MTPEVSRDGSAGPRTADSGGTDPPRPLPATPGRRDTGGPSGQAYTTAFEEESATPELLPGAAARGGPAAAEPDTLKGPDLGRRGAGEPGRRGRSRPPCGGPERSPSPCHRAGQGTSAGP